MKTFLQSLKTLLIATVLFAGVALVSAQVGTWTPPSQPPTDGNTPAPLNVGTLDQVKSAGLSLNRLLVNGQVAINDGTAAVGRVLTSLDGNGTAQWAAVGAVGGGGLSGLEYKENAWQAFTSTGTQNSPDNRTTTQVLLGISPYPSGGLIATCSAGKKVITGGCEMDGYVLHTTVDGFGNQSRNYTISNSGSIFNLYTNRPTNDGVGWVCDAAQVAVGDGSNYRSTFSYGLYSLKASAVCVSNSGGGSGSGFEYETNLYTNPSGNASPVTSITASCSTGKKVVNGGCGVVTVGGRGSVPSESRPANDGSGWVCSGQQGVLVGDPYLGSIKATAICQ